MNHDFANSQAQQGFGNSALSQLGAQIAPEHPVMGLFRKYAAAKQEFDDACHNFAQAEQRRAAAGKVLHELSAQVDETVKRGTLDPTTPQAQAPPTPYVR